MLVPIGVYKIKARGGRKEKPWVGPKRYYRAYFLDDETGKLVTRYVKGLEVWVLKAQVHKRKILVCPSCKTKFMSLEKIGICPKCGANV